MCPGWHACGGGFDMDAVLEKDIGGAQNVLALIGGVGDVMETALPATMLLGAGKVIGLVVDGEPAPAQPTIVERDHLGDAAAQACLHERTELGDIFCQKIEVIDPARTAALPMIAAGQILERRASSGAGS